MSMVRSSASNSAGAALSAATALPELTEGTATKTVAPRALKKNAEGKFIGQRKVKPKVLAVITDACTGCAGAPVCQIYCPVDDCMLLVPADDALPFGRIWVDPLKCVGCRKCVRHGPAETFLDGCPWDAIEMVPTPEWEARHGVLPY